MQETGSLAKNNAKAAQNNRQIRLPLAPFLQTSNYSPLNTPEVLSPDPCRPSATYTAEDPVRSRCCPALVVSSAAQAVFGSHESSIFWWNKSTVSETPTGSAKPEQFDSDQHDWFLLQRSSGLSSRLAVLSLEVLFLWSRGLVLSSPTLLLPGWFSLLDLNIPFLTDSVSPHS